MATNTNYPLNYNGIQISIDSQKKTSLILFDENITQYNPTETAYKIKQLIQDNPDIRFYTFRCFVENKDNFYEEVSKISIPFYMSLIINEINDPKHTHNIKMNLLIQTMCDLYNQTMQQDNKTQPGHDQNIISKTKNLFLNQQNLPWKE